MLYKIYISNHRYGSERATPNMTGGDENDRGRNGVGHRRSPSLARSRPPSPAANTRRSHRDAFRLRPPRWHRTEAPTSRVLRPDVQSRTAPRLRSSLTCSSPMTNGSGGSSRRSWQLAGAASYLLALHRHRERTGRVGRGTTTASRRARACTASTQGAWQRLVNAGRPAHPAIGRNVLVGGSPGAVTARRATRRQGSFSSLRLNVTSMSSNPLARWASACPV